jgi:chromosome segregation ATPase
MECAPILVVVSIVFVVVALAQAAYANELKEKLKSSERLFDTWSKSTSDQIEELKLQLSAADAQNEAVSSQCEQLRDGLKDQIAKTDEAKSELTNCYRNLEAVNSQRDQFKRDAETARIVVSQKIEQLSAANSEKFNLSTELDRLKIAIKENSIARRKKSWKQFVSELLPS